MKISLTSKTDCGKMCADISRAGVLRISLAGDRNHSPRQMSPANEKLLTIEPVFFQPETYVCSQVLEFDIHGLEPAFWADTDQELPWRGEDGSVNDWNDVEPPQLLDGHIAHPHCQVLSLTDDRGTHAGKKGPHNNATRKQVTRWYRTSAQIRGSGLVVNPAMAHTSASIRGGDFGLLHKAPSLPRVSWTDENIVPLSLTPQRECATMDENETEFGRKNAEVLEQRTIVLGKIMESL